MDKLVELLKKLVDRTTWTSEQARNDALDLLRHAEDALGLTTSVVGPKPGAGAAPISAPAPSTPAPLAAPQPDTQGLIAAGWTPPTSPEVASTPPEQQNVFADAQKTAPGDSSVPPDASA